MFYGSTNINIDLLSNFELSNLLRLENNLFINFTNLCINNI